MRGKVRGVRGKQGKVRESEGKVREKRGKLRWKWRKVRSKEKTRENWGEMRRKVKEREGKWGEIELCITCCVLLKVSRSLDLIYICVLTLWNSVSPCCVCQLLVSICFFNVCVCVCVCVCVWDTSTFTFYFSTNKTRKLTLKKYHSHFPLLIWQHFNCWLFFSS